MKDGWPKGALTIDGPRPEIGREAARVRFFILDESLRGLGLGKSMLAAAMQFCRERQYRRIFLTTLPGLEAAMRLYEAYGFTEVAQSEEGFHGSRFVEMTMECHLR
jgi:ribosomal protein S18 acetylase RimI-like enzyme